MDLQNRAAALELLGGLTALQEQEKVAAQEWWASINRLEQWRWLNAAGPIDVGVEPGLHAYRFFKNAMQHGCAYSISIRPKALGGGYNLTLVSDGVEMGGGVFPADEYDRDLEAYYDARNTASVWVEREELNEALDWWASINKLEQCRWLNASGPFNDGDDPSLNAYRYYRKTVQHGGAFLVTIHPEKLGGGYNLKLLKDGSEAGEVVFLADDYDYDFEAYYHAQNVGAEWQERNSVLFRQHMHEAGAVDLGGGSWEWENPDFFFQLWRIARDSTRVKSTSTSVETLAPGHTQVTPE